MRNNLILLLTFLCLATVVTNGQVADGISYQAVALDENGREIAGQDINGNVISGKTIDVRFSVISGTPEGEILYKEAHSVNTDQYGLFSLVIGHGDVSPDGRYEKLTEIEWGAGRLYLRVEIDTRRTGNFKVMGIQQMMAVPFAFHALNSKPMDAGTVSQYWRGDRTWQTLDKEAVDLENVENVALSTWRGTSNLNTAGTIITGTWNAGPVTSSGALTGNTIVKTGGTSSQFLKADGSVDDNSYITAIREMNNEFTATEGQSRFTLTQRPSPDSNVKMFINGVRISNSAYTISGNSVTYLPAGNGSNGLRAGDRIQFDYYY
ncbi:MAG: hypothetical protein WAW07_01875 [Bacteroidales bacterium]